MVTDTGTGDGGGRDDGIGPFLAFADLPTVEDRLAGGTARSKACRDVLRRRVPRVDVPPRCRSPMDPDTPLIHQAALLHDFAELLLWCHAPVLAMELSPPSAVIRTLLRDGAACRAGVPSGRPWAIRPDANFGACTIASVKTADERHAEHLSVKTVALPPCGWLRHSAHGWEIVAQGDDLRGR